MQFPDLFVDFFKCFAFDFVRDETHERHGIEIDHACDSDLIFVNDGGFRIMNAADGGYVFGLEFAGD